MWHAVELAGELFDLFLNWRLYLCLVVALGIAWVIDPNLPWFVVAPLLLAGFLVGVFWQWGK